jgi:surface polysaccharide O-acyltransferase-like enzyme
LTGVYLAVPILRVLVRSSKNAELAYFVLLWFFAGPVLSILVKIVGRPPGLDEIPLASSYVGYFVLGYTARRFDFFRQAHFFIAVTAVCIAVTFLGTYYLSLRSNQFNGFFYDYLSLNIVAVSFSSFILILNWAWAKKPNPFFQVLSSLSFGIYLIHIFILEVFRRGTLGFKLAGWLAPPFYMIPVTSLAVFVVSALVVAILRKIPLAKFIVP